MANFFLVHGAWHGGWCWQRVSALLQKDGHCVHAVTLTGLGERAHLLSPAITLDTHIDDVINLIKAEELGEVVLAVHSYAGMIGTAVADRLGQRLKHLVYVDAVLPKPGESWSSTQSAATQQQRLPGRSLPGCSALRRPTRRCSDCRARTVSGCGAARRRIRATPTRRRCSSTCSAWPRCRAPMSAAPSPRCPPSIRAAFGPGTRCFGTAPGYPMQNSWSFAPAMTRWSASLRRWCGFCWRAARRLCEAQSRTRLHAKSEFCAFFTGVSSYLNNSKN